MKEHEVIDIRGKAVTSLSNLNKKYQPDDRRFIKVRSLVRVCREVMTLCDIVLGDEELE